KSLMNLAPRPKIAPGGPTPTPSKKNASAKYTSPSLRGEAEAQTHTVSRSLGHSRRLPSMLHRVRSSQRSGEPAAHLTARSKHESSWIQRSRRRIPPRLPTSLNPDEHSSYHANISSYLP